MSLESGIAGAPTHLARRSQSSHPAPFVPLVEYEDASPGAKAVFDTIIARRGLKDASQINNFWRALANDEKTLKRTWESVEEVMAPGGALDPLVKQLIYIAVSQVNNCGYCQLSHGAAAKKLGMTAAMFMELSAVVAMANETNRLATALRVPPDEEAFGNVPFAESQS